MVYISDDKPWRDRTDVLLFTRPYPEAIRLAVSSADSVACQARKIVWWDEHVS